MANGNGFKIPPWAIQFVLFIITLIVFTVGAPIWVESRIESKVEAEAVARQKADDLNAEQRSREYQRIYNKLDDIERYLREHK